MINRIIRIATIFSILFLSLALSSFSESHLEILVQNKLDFNRENETIEISWKEISQKLQNIAPDQIIVVDIRTGKQIPIQFLNDSSQNLVSLLFQTTIAPNTTNRYIVKKGIRVAVMTKTFGRFVPERMDDFAWENDRIAHRMYGPALQATGEMSSGVDVWVKRTRELIIDKWYKSKDYHTDHGEGLDYYSCGPTLGAGGIAPYLNGKLFRSKNFTSYKVIANGPIRTVFELKYAPWDVEGESISETKTISIDAGSNLSRFESVYNTQSHDSISVAIGILKRVEPGCVMLDEKKGISAYWQPRDDQHGTTGIGVVLPANTQAQMNIDEGHFLSVQRINPDSRVVYYAGACWDKGGDYADMPAWQKYLSDFKKRLENPLLIKIQ
jgi:hypothetical protein